MTVIEAIALACLFPFICLLAVLASPQGASHD